jgi:hypothetical protein
MTDLTARFPLSQITPFSETTPSTLCEPGQSQYLERLWTVSVATYGCNMEKSDRKKDVLGFWQLSGFDSLGVIESSRSIWTIWARVFEFKNSGHVISEKRKSRYRWGRMRNTYYGKWRNTAPERIVTVPPVTHTAGPWQFPLSFTYCRTVTVPPQFHIL